MNITLITDDPETIRIFEFRPHLYRVTVYDRLPAHISDILKDEPQVIFIVFFLKEENCGALCHQLKSDAAARLIPLVLLSTDTVTDQLASRFGCQGVLRKEADTYQYLSAISRCVEQQLSDML